MLLYCLQVWCSISQNFIACFNNDLYWSNVNVRKFRNILLAEIADLCKLNVDNNDSMCVFYCEYWTIEKSSSIKLRLALFPHPQWVSGMKGEGSFPHSQALWKRPGNEAKMKGVVVVCITCGLWTRPYDLLPHACLINQPHITVVVGELLEVAICLFAYFVISILRQFSYQSGTLSSEMCTNMKLIKET